MLLSDSRRVRDFCDSVADAPYIAVDTEFLREKTYFPQLCLIQIGYGDRVAAIDPLKDGIDLDPVFDLLEDESLLKVFHSASQDLEVLLNVGGSLPRPVFDTQIAAMVCGFGEQPGYAAVVSELLQIEIDKGSQFTDWSRRPLSERQIEYALGDVIHLCPVYESLLDQLSDRGRLDWIDEEMEGLADESNFRVDPREMWRRVKIRRPNRRTLGLLRELAEWRETTAQQKNLPRNWVAKDEALANLAAQPPNSPKGLAAVRGLSSGIAAGRDGERLYDAILRGLDLDESELPILPPRRPPPPPGQDRLVALLQALLRIRADEEGVAACLIANRSDLDQLALRDDPDIRALRGWRYEIFGKYALDLKEGRLGLTGDRDGVRIIDTPPPSSRSTRRRRE